MAAGRANELRWPLAVAIPGFSAIISFLTSDNPVPVWGWLVALTPVLIGVAWGAWLFANPGRGPVLGPEVGEGSSVAKDIVVPLVSAVLGSGLLIFLLNRPVVASEQIRACEDRHGMEHAVGDVQELRVTQSERQLGVYAKEAIATCEWPPREYADDDGFSRIILVTQEGPGPDEASSANALDRYTGSCTTLRVAYSTGTQGDFSHQPPFVIERGEIVDAWEGEPWPPADSSFRAGDIQPYPGRDEFIVVRNSKIGPDVTQVHCAS